MAEAAEKAMGKWIRVVANMSLGAYEISEATADLPDPVWPADLTFAEILKVAFRDRYVDSPDHPPVKRLGTWRGRYTPEEILDYCETDVVALARLLASICRGRCCVGVSWR